MTFEKLAGLLADQLNIDVASIKEDSNIFEDLGADSIDTLELVMLLEEEYGVTIPEDEINNVKTVKDILNLFNK